MSTLRVTAEPPTVHEHPNADALELAQVGLFRAVVAKGAFRDGDAAVYVPEGGAAAGARRGAGADGPAGRRGGEPGQGGAAAR